MAALKKMTMIFGIILVLGLGGFVFVKFYKYIFARHVKGVIVDIKQIDMNALLLSPGATNQVNPQIHSYAVAIKDETGEILTASAEDRQWAVAKPGQCAEAVYYPYPPWELEKANTYHGARLEKLYDCSK